MIYWFKRKQGFAPSLVGPKGLAVSVLRLRALEQLLDDPSVLFARRAASFIVGSGLGYIPQMVVFALVGTGITVDPALRIGCGVALFAVSGAFGVHLYRKYRHGKTFDDRIDSQLDEGD